MGCAYMFVSAFYVAMAVLQGQSRNNVVAVAFVVGAWLITVPFCYPLSHHQVRPHTRVLFIRLLYDDARSL